MKGNSLTYVYHFLPKSRSSFSFVDDKSSSDYLKADRTSFMVQSGKACVPQSMK